MADLNRAVEAMAEMDPDGEISAESMARLAEIAPAARPVDVNAAKATVQGLGNDAVAVLAANGADERARVRDFHALFTRDFDIPLIARFALGRYWRSTTAAQREAYTAAFADAIVSAYAHRLSDIELDRFRVTDAEQSGKHDVLVHSLITRPGKEAVRLIWRVRARDDGRYRVIDVVFEDISMALTKREEYAAIIQASGGRVDALIEKMIAKES